METRRYLRRNNTLSSRNALIDDGLEVVPIDSGLESSPAEYHLATCGPQAVIGDEQKEVYPHHEDRPSRTCEPVGGMLSKRSWIWFTIIVTLIIIAVVLAVAIPLTRNRHNSSAQTSATPNATSNTNATVSKPALNLSTSGAFNGTGIALLDLGIGSVDLFFYYQHYTGQIRASELRSNVWRQGQNNNIVVTSNVKNGTPISAVAYTKDAVTTWHVFYVDSSNIIQEAINSNTTNSWVSGPLGSFRFRVSDGSGASLTACSNDEFYGTTLGTSGGIRLFYGASNTTAQELVWTYGSTSWTRGYTFSNANGNGGLSCQGVGSGITYLYLLNLNSRIELRWKEFNTAAINSTSHPIGVWNKGPAAAVSVNANSSLSSNNNVYFQDPSNNIIGIPINGSAEASSFQASFQVGGGVSAMPKTQIAATTFFPTADTPSELHVFFQTNGSDITEFLRAQNGGQWSSNNVPVG